MKRKLWDAAANRSSFSAKRAPPSRAPPGSPHLQNYTLCNRICHLAAAASRERLKSGSFVPRIAGTRWNSV